MQPTAKQARHVWRYEPLTGHLWWRERGLGRRFSKPCGSASGKGYIHVEYKGVAYKAHHIIWLIVTGRWPRDQIDHKDLCCSNNAWSNLREATNGQNKANTRLYKNNNSGYRGVVKRPGYDRWRAVINVNHVRINIGDFATPEEAHAACVAAAKQHFGEFARAQ